MGAPLPYISPRDPSGPTGVGAPWPNIPPPKGYLVHASNTDEKLEFQYNPDKIRDSHSMAVGNVNIPGSSHPIIAPARGGMREIKFALTFYADGDTEIMMANLNWLKSVEYPETEKRAGVNTYEAPLLIFIYGKLYRLPVYVTKLDMELGDVFSADLLPIYAKINVVLQEVANTAILANMVRYGAGFSRVR